MQVLVAHQSYDVPPCIIKRRIGVKIQKQNKSLYSARERRRMRIGFLYAVPWLIGFLVFKGYPFLSSLYYSFTDMNLQKSSYWYTLDNYRQIFTDPQMLKVLTITFKYAFLTVPLKLTAALFIAYILCFNLKGVRFFRTAFYHIFRVGIHVQNENVDEITGFRTEALYWAYFGYVFAIFQSTESPSGNCIRSH